MKKRSRQSTRKEANLIRFIRLYSRPTLPDLRFAALSQCLGGQVLQMQPPIVAAYDLLDFIQVQNAGFLLRPSPKRRGY
jgi:hypothetical protein